MPDSAPETGLDQFRQFIYSSYSETHFIYSDDAASAGKGRALSIETLLGKTLPADKTAPILDFGCGDGQLLSVAQKLGYSNLSGVDLSKGLLEKAARRTSAKLHHGPGLDFLKSSADARFEVIIAYDVFEHLTRPELLAICREVSRTLKAGGRLILHVPNGASPFCGRDLWGDITHERAYTQSSLAQVLLPLGFKDIEAMEEGPVPHGVKSAVRAVLWGFFRGVMVLLLAAETGRLRGHILTSNMCVTAQKGAMINPEDKAASGARKPATR